MNGFPAGPTNAIYAQAGIADLDADDLPEIMIDDNVFTRGYECYNNDGSHCPEWPLPCGTGGQSITMQMTPIFGDFDLDGLLEITGAATGFTTYVVECCLWDTESPWNEELAYMPIDGCNIQHNGLYPQEFPPPPPEAPTDCSAVLVDYNDAVISWVMEDAGQTGFNIYCNGEAIIEISDPQLREYIHYSLDNGLYDYCVTALYDELESDPSPTAAVMVSLLPPQNITYVAVSGNVYLYWNSPSAERELTGYNIYRDDVIIATVVDTIFTDAGLAEDTYEYYLTTLYSDSLESVPSETISILVTSISGDDIAGWDYQLANYPNPFNPATRISFQLADPALLSLKIYNCTGQLIKTFPITEYNAGISTIVWEGTDNDLQPVASGIYIIRLISDDFSISSKMMMLK